MRNSEEENQSTNRKWSDVMLKGQNKQKNWLYGTTSFYMFPSSYEVCCECYEMFTSYERSEKIACTDDVL